MQGKIHGSIVSVLLRDRMYSQSGNFAVSVHTHAVCYVFVYACIDAWLCIEETADSRERKGKPQ